MVGRMGAGPGPREPEPLLAPNDDIDGVGVGRLLGGPDDGCPPPPPLLPPPNRLSNGSAGLAGSARLLTTMFGGVSVALVGDGSQLRARKECGGGGNSRRVVTDPNVARAQIVRRLYKTTQSGREGFGAHLGIGACAGVGMMLAVLELRGNPPSVPCSEKVALADLRQEFIRACVFGRAMRTVHHRACVMPSLSGQHCCCALTYLCIAAAGNGSSVNRSLCGAAYEEGAAAIHTCQTRRLPTGNTHIHLRTQLISP